MGKDTRWPAGDRLRSERRRRGRICRSKTKVAQNGSPHFPSIEISRDTQVSPNQKVIRAGDVSHSRDFA